MKIILLLFVVIVSQLTSCTTDMYGNSKISGIGWLIIVILVIGALIPLIRIALRREQQGYDRMKIEDDQRTQKISQLKALATTVISDNDNKQYIAIYESENRIVISDDRTIRIDDLLWVELRIDDNIITQKSNANTVGRAIVGGVLAGGAGAIIGGLSGKTTQKKEIKKINIIIGQRDLSEPIITLNCYEVDPMHSKWFEDARAVDMLNYAQQVTDLLSVIIEAQEKYAQGSENVQMSNDNQHLSVADELKKLKDLLDSGILTPDEFQEQKKRLLEQ